MSSTFLEDSTNQLYGYLRLNVIVNVVLYSLPRTEKEKHLKRTEEKIVLQRLMRKNEISKRKKKILLKVEIGNSSGYGKSKISGMNMSAIIVEKPA